MNKWKEIWNKRNVSAETTLEELLKEDGFDSGAGKMGVEAWREYGKFIHEKLKLNGDDTIFEIGCGSGAFLYLFYELGYKVGGIDYSEVLVNKAKVIMPKMEINVAEAIDLDSSKKNDIVVSNGVFHYFPNLEYAEKVIEKMINKAFKKVSILEVPNINLQEESEKARRGMLPKGEYEEKYKDLPHLYYDQNWFYEIGRKYNCKVNTFPQNIKGYGNNKFRFNCIMEKLIE